MNEQKDTFRRLRCGRSEDEYEHIAENALKLSCDHWICKKCIPSRNEFKCTICGNETSHLKLEATSSATFNGLLEASIKTVFSCIYENFTQKLKQSENAFDDLEDSVDLKIEYVKEEIQIRIESLKIELEKLEEHYNSELDRFKQKWKYEVTSKNNRVEFDANPFKKEISDLQILIATHQNLTRENVYKYQNRIKELNNYIKSIEIKRPVVDFDASRITIAKEMIGDLLLDFDDCIIMKKLSEAKYETLNIANGSQFDLCLLPNENILICANSGLLLYNDKQELIKKISEIDHQEINPVSATTNGSDELYLVNYRNDSVIKTDLDFNLLARFGSEGTGIHNLIHPRGICYNDNYVYICDSDNKRIQKLDTNLMHQQHYDLGFCPERIKVLNNILFISTLSGVTYFYDTQKLTILSKTNSCSRIIGTSHSYFYQYDVSERVAYCYDRNANLCRYFQIDFPIYSNFGAILVNRSKLYLWSYGSDKIFIV